MLRGDTFRHQLYSVFTAEQLALLGEGTIPVARLIINESKKPPVVREPTDQPRGTPPVLVPVLVIPVPPVPVNSRSICSRTGTTCVMHYYFTTREARVIPTHTCGIIGHS